ncbi:hypothetical protein [Celeribacter baekdonensis]|nr:hypothetical protein [Celeribacter baekdonensis]
MILGAEVRPKMTDVLKDFVSDTDIIARVKDKGPGEQSSGYEFRLRIGMV